MTAAGLVPLQPSYIGAYSPTLGQHTLSPIAICRAMALWWLYG
ncbi:MAG: hypothetical protein ACT4OX_07890 [Actinomycetota bacterium]